MGAGDMFDKAKDALSKAKDALSGHGDKVDEAVDKVNVQVLGLAAAVRDRRLRFGGRRGVAVVAERGFGDDPGL